MPQYQAGQVRLESGALPSATMLPVPRITSVRVGANLPRINVGILNRGKPLAQRPILNYTPVNGEFDYYHTDLTIPAMLGITGTLGVCAGIIETKGTIATFGVRSAQVAFAPTSSSSYNGLIDLKSGVLNSWGIQGSVSEPVRGSFGLEFLEMSGSLYGASRDSTNIDASFVKPENVSLGALALSGLGFTGVTFQSFGFNVGFARQGVQQLGAKFPVERPLTDVGATLQVQGFFDGINNSMTGLSQYDNGQSFQGSVALTLVPFGVNASTTITMLNPYLDNFSIESQVGGFSTVSVSFSLPIGPNPNETADGSVVRIT